MSDEKRENLTPAEQRTLDRAQVTIQIAQTDISEAVRKGVPFGGPPPGRTSFEGTELNSLIDLVENTRPEDLESAGKALWAARDAISKAAEELDTYLKGVTWQGEAGTAFRAFGKGLVAHARELGDFAEVAGTQITVAGTGLASVRSAMPPRDDRQVRKSPDDVEHTARTADNPEYQAALKVEKNRQEAINQINRLASYYAVSGKRLEKQEPPRFEELLPIDMPPPVGGVGLPTVPGGSSREDVLAGSAAAQSSAARSLGGAPEEPGAFGGRSGVDPLGPSPELDKAPATEINSTALHPAPPTNTATPPLPTPAPTTGQAGGPPSPLPAGPPVGRPGPLGGGGASFPGRSPGSPQPTSAGQSGVTGGRPVVGQGGTSAVGGPRAAGRSGIVGGAPQRPPQNTAASPGSAQRGVIGGRGGAVGSRVGGRTTPGPGANGVVGAARKASGGKGFTAGGEGLVRGPAGRGNKGRGVESNRPARPDYLTEDEETWNTGRRGFVPPAVE
ncbi:hypothetical protein RB625_18930 [Streptomyces californicus]|uniref:hypothetical protein n=1 Tax=Streptomyces californicus TaxID=67351 RepID=UPI00296EAFD2|nr:hypothetical protein [Streptomyces californicus]MDW4900489.1 hypothetical protein [Streptomyces californicus]